MNKNILKSVAAVGLAAGILSSCSKSTPTLNVSVPMASFTYNMLRPTSDTTAENLELINTSTNAMTGYWSVTDDEGNTIGTYTGDTVKLAIVFAGTYNVKMAAAGPGGLSDTIQQTVTIDKDNTYAAGATTLLGVLTGAALGKTQRTWMADRVVNSVIVAPGPANNGEGFTTALNQINGTGGGVWWAFGPGEIDPKTGRNGYFDDQYTFTFGKTGQLIYDDNKTVYLDQGGSGWTKALPSPWNSYLGTTSSTDLYNLVPALKPWGSGTFSYALASAPVGAMKLGQITVKGVGAHFGLPDKTNAGELVTPTVSSITYDVLQLQTGLKDSDGTIYDEITVGLTYDSAGDVWTFMFRSNR